MENQIEKTETNEVEKKKRQPRKKGCTQCKKKVIKELEPLVEEIYIPTSDEIKLAFYELTSMKGVIEDKKPFISKVYETLFQEKFDWSCVSCAHIQVRKLEAYCNKNKIKL